MNNKVQQYYYKKNPTQQLKGFYYTAKLGTASAAAKYLNVVQSAITMQIKSLERDLDTTLFSRQKGKLQITKDGETLLAMVEPILNDLDGIFDLFLNKKREQEVLSLKVAVHHSAINSLLPPVIREFQEEFPKCKISIHNVTASEAQSRLFNEEIDIALYAFLELGNEFATHHVFSFDPQLIMHHEHPLANKEKVDLDDIKKYPLIRIDATQITLPLFEATVKQHKIDSNITFENGNWHMLKALVKENLGLAVVTDLVLDRDNSLIVKKSLSHIFPHMEYRIVTRRGIFLTKTMHRFIELCKQYPVK